MLLNKLKIKLQLHLFQLMNTVFGPRTFHVFQKSVGKMEKSRQNIFESVLLWLLGVEEYATTGIFSITPQISHVDLCGFRLSIKISYFL